MNEKHNLAPPSYRTILYLSVFADVATALLVWSAPNDFEAENRQHSCCEVLKIAPFGAMVKSPLKKFQTCLRFVCCTGCTCEDAAEGAKLDARSHSRRAKTVQRAERNNLVPPRPGRRSPSSSRECLNVTPLHRSTEGVVEVRTQLVRHIAE